MMRLRSPPPQRFANRTSANPRAPDNWRVCGVRERAISEPWRPRTAIATASMCSVLQAMRNVAVKSAVRGRS
eukprot:5710473-Lingulodinium_polyedra.AAC.1